MSAQKQGSFVSASWPAEVGDPAPYFRREFAVTEGLHRAVLKVSALGIVVPYLNGARVGEDVLSPGWTSYRHHLDLRAYDVTDQVAVGANAVGAIVGEGWAVGALTWENRRHNYADRPALFLQLELHYPDRVEVISTDEQFQVGTGAVRANGLYAGEAYDARLEPDGWAQAGFDAGDWRAVERFDWNLTTLQDPIAPPIRRIEELTPVTIHVRPDGRTIVDFGQIITGWVRLRVTGDAGRTVVLRHAELLTAERDLETETNRSAEATDRYTLRGGGLESWEPAFTFHGFRYVEVEGWPGSLSPEALRAIVVHSDMPRTGWFETSDDLVNQLHTNTVWSMRGNFVGVPTDCPQRDERLGWTGDLNAFAPTAGFLYDVRGVLGSWLKDLSAEQIAAGTVPWVVPDVLPTPSSATALWSDVAVSLPWALYQEYGDLEILRHSYASMTAYIREVETALDEHGLWSSGFQFGDWLDPDAPPDNPAGGKTDPYLVASAYLCKTTREIADTADLLGQDDDARQFRQLHQRVRHAFRREFVSASGRVVNESATAYALTLMFGILDDDQRQKAGDRLARIVAKAGYTISTGFAGTPLVVHALSSTGHLNEAYTLLMQQKCPSFLYPVTMGATTIWERWDSILPDGTLNSTGMTSLNHYALGAVADWLHRVVGGLSADEPGWTRIRIAPQPGGGLTFARTAHDTIHGRAEVTWRIAIQEMHLDVTVPPGTTATVVFPLHPDHPDAQVGPGTFSWRYPLPPGYGAPVAFSMDTPMGELSADTTVWAAVTEVLRAHFPGVPIEAGGDRLSAMTLNAIVERLPRSVGLERDLRTALMLP